MLFLVKYLIDLHVVPASPDALEGETSPGPYDKSVVEFVVNVSVGPRSALQVFAWSNKKQMKMKIRLKFWVANDTWVNFMHCRVRSSLGYSQIKKSSTMKTRNFHLSLKALISLFEYTYLLITI